MAENPGRSYLLNVVYTDDGEHGCPDGVRLYPSGKVMRGGGKGPGWVENRLGEDMLSGIWYCPWCGVSLKENVD